MPAMMRGFPSQLGFTFKHYMPSNFISTGSGTPNGMFQVGVNNPYDPFLSLGGNSAALFDNMMELYGRGRVVKAKVTLDCVNQRTDQGVYVCMIIVTDSSTTDVSYLGTYSWNAIPTSQRSRIAYIPPLGSGNNHTKLVKTFDFRTLVDDLLDHPYSWVGQANPTKIISVKVVACSCLTAGGSEVDLGVNVQLEMDSILTEPHTTEQNVDD